MGKTIQSILGYTGVRAATPPNLTVNPNRPQPTFIKNFKVGDFWLYLPNNPNDAELFVLMSLAGNVADWVLLTGTAGAVTGTVTDDLLIETPDPVLGLLSLAGDGNIVTSQGGTHEAKFSLAPSISVQTLNARNNTASANAPALLNFIKTRNNGPVNSGDDIGCVNWFGFDTNSNPILTAQICTFATGVGVNQMGGIMRFYTTPVIPLTAPRNRVEIDEKGIVSINQADNDTWDFDTPSFFAAGSSVITFSNSTTPATGAFTTLLRTHGVGAIQSGDQIGIINFAGRDTNGSIVAGGSIKSISSGTIAPSRVAGNLVFGTHPDTATNELTLDRVTILSAGNMVVNKADNDATSPFSSGTATFACLGRSILSQNDESNTNAPISQFTKTRAGGAITSGDILGALTFVGYDTGSSPIVGAQISSTSSGTIGANRVPANLSFFTHPDSAVAATQRMTIQTTGVVTVLAPDTATAAVQVQGSLSVQGDPGAGVAASTDFTNVTAAAGGGAGAVALQAGGVGVAQAGWLKIYVNGVVSYIPYYQ